MPRDIKLNVVTAVDEKGLVHAAGAVGKLDDKVGKLGDELKDTASDAAVLDKRLEATGRKVKELAREIVRATDEVKRADLEKAFGDEKRTLAKLRAVRRELDDVGDEADEAARKMAKVAAVGAGAAGAGAKSGAAFAGLFSKAVGSPLTLALIAGASAAAPLIGSVVGAALVGGAGAGGVGVGIAGAFTDPRVKAAAKEFGADVTSDFKAIIQKTFIDPSLDGIARFRKAWRGELRPEVEGLLRASAKLVDPLVDAGIGFTKGLLPGIRSMVEDAGPVFDVLGKDLPALGRSLGLTFEEIGEHSEAISVGLHDAFIAIEGTVAAAGFLVSYLSESYALTRKIAGFTGGPLALLDGGEVSKFKVIGEESSNALDTMGRSADDARTKLDQLFDELDEGVRKAFGLEEAQDAVANTLARLTEQMARQREEHVKGAGSLDRNTQAGRDNAELVRDLVEEYAVLARKQSEAGGKVDGLRQQLVNQLIQLGLTRKAAEQYADALNKIPKNITSAVRVKFISDKSQYHPPTNVGVGVTIGYAKGGIAKAQQGLITSKPAVLFGERGTGQEAFIPKLGIGRQRAASLLGTAAGWHGMDVVPRSGYNSMPPARSGVGGRVKMEMSYAGSGNDLIDALMRSIRVRVISDGGGNVQLALGN